MEKRPIILQGAMDIEIEYFKKVIKNLKVLNLYGYETYEGEYEDYPIIISKTNVGLIESAVCTFCAITKYNPIAIISQGTAGACSKDIHKNDIVIGCECLNINSYITKGKSENEGILPLEWELLTFKEGKDELIKYKADEKLCKIAQSKEEFAVGNVKQGIIGSGDVWNNEIDRIKWFNEKYGILCEDMETVATYSICKKMNIPVLGIRVISDNSILKEEYDRNVAIEARKIYIRSCERTNKNI